MNASWQAIYAHLCAASIIRAMPETEIPPAMRGDVYFRKVGTALHCLPVLSRIRIILEQPPFSLFRMMEAAGTTEELKARNPMRWAGLMNTLKAQAEELVLNELIYS